jgi:NhaA family Na+:H+ antiporter
VTESALLPETPIDRLTLPLRRFLHVEAASGFVLLVASCAALALANSPLAEPFLAIWKTRVRFGIGAFELEGPLKHWINDGLMAVFFFVIGLEVKREVALGELRDAKRAALPIAAALGGMIAPAAIYLALQWGEPGARGWGIPMATDIAFVVGALALLGQRVPPSLRVFLLSLAIADDIGAILVIAIGYSAELSLAWLGAGLTGIGLVAGLARLGVRSVGVYTLCGAGIWLAFHESGVHATIAGVILGMMTPARSFLRPSAAGAIFQRAAEFLRGGGAAPVDAALGVESVARESVSPLERLESLLHPWVSFAVMPVFALANAGVAIHVADFGDPVAIAVAAGLVVGKPLGILLASRLAIALGIARLPEDLDWSLLAGAGLLAAIGFTMAIFIAGLALDAGALDTAKVGILAASALGGIAGMLVLAMRLPAAGERP